MAPLFAKIFEKMLENWGRSMVRDGHLHISSEQGGFMPKRSTHDSGFILESLRDAQIKRHKKLYAVFLDLRKAFDTVNHKIFLQKIGEQPGVDRAWVRQISRMLVDRKLKLYDAMIHLKVGTVQGSPISPLLFILFIDPLIQRLKKLHLGINLLNKEASCMICCLLFADDTALLAESLEDLDAMLRVCSEWASEFGMSFGPSKSQATQLAGKLPKQRPEIQMDGEVLPWVSEVKYLGFSISEGRRKRIAAPIVKMWKSYHRIKKALDANLPIPIKNQLILIQSDIMSVAMYPTPIRDMDYGKIDRFMTRMLNRITGCEQRWTSATFLRAELGVPQSKFLGHYRALSYYWHLCRETWFCDLLPLLEGTGPLQRITGFANLYNLDLTRVHDISHGQWKKEAKTAIMIAAQELASAGLRDDKRQYQLDAEFMMKPRPYIKLGGANGRYGVHYRWIQIRDRDPRFRDIRTLRIENSPPCEICGGVHANPTDPTITEMFECPIYTPPELRGNRDAALQAIAEEIARQQFDPSEALPEWILPHLDRAVTTLEWPNQSQNTTRPLLHLIGCIVKSHNRQVVKKRRLEHVLALREEVPCVG
jgi:hypothetical protein